MNPEVFKIIDGKLYLSWSKESQEKFTEKSAEKIKEADENWKKINRDAE